MCLDMGAIRSHRVLVHRGCVAAFMDRLDLCWFTRTIGVSLSSKDGLLSFLGSSRRQAVVA